MNKIFFIGITGRFVRVNVVTCHHIVNIVLYYIILCYYRIFSAIVIISSIHSC